MSDILAFNYTLYHKDPNRNLADPDVVKLHAYHFQSENDNADVWRQHRLMEPVLHCMAYTKNDRWLTVGDGAYGLESIRMRRKGFQHVLPTDICETLLQVAQNEGLIDEFRVENAEALSFADESFDYVLCKDSYHHMPRPMIGLYEMLRVARKAVVLIEPQDPWSDHPVMAGDPIAGYESVGNYVYTVSRRELTKVALGLDLPAVAFKSIFDHCPEQIERISADVSDPRFQAYLQAIAQGEMLCRNMQQKHNILFAVIFKVSPDQAVVDAFTERSSGWSFTYFPGNPHRRPTAVAHG